MSKDLKYKFILIPPFHLPDENEFTVPGYSVPKDKSREERLLNADFTSHWKTLINPPRSKPPYGNWSVETREEFAHAATARMSCREARETGKYNAAILLGGGEPDLESREIGREFGVVVTANAFSQMYLATMLGDSFSIIDIEGVTMPIIEICSDTSIDAQMPSIRSIGYSLPRPEILTLTRLLTRSCSKG